MKIGDVYIVTKYESMHVVGIASEDSNQDGYFYAWEIIISKSDGRLMSLSQTTRKLPDAAIVVMPNDSAPSIVDQAISMVDKAFEREQAQSTNPLPNALSDMLKAFEKVDDRTGKVSE
jgi:hypothetical protein